MAVLISRAAFLALIIRIKADDCFERFGSNEANCTATSGRCLWVEKDGEGRCIMPTHPENHLKPPDACFEQFGSNEANCTATNGQCLWVEKDGEGKCVMPRHSRNHSKPLDGCFERFGFNEANCTASKGSCLWVEQHGAGKCVMARRSKHHSNDHHSDRNRTRYEHHAHEQGSDRVGKGGSRDRVEPAEKSHREGGSKAQHGRADRTHQTGGPAKKARVAEVKKLTGILSIFLSSSLASAEVLDNLNQLRFLLESPLADSYVYKKVTILGLDLARRLRAAISTQVHVLFEAETTEGVPSSDQARSSPLQLQGALQQSFTKAGLDFQVQSATVAITRSEVVSTPSPHGGKGHGHRIVLIGAVAAGVLTCCTCMMMGLLWSRRRAAAKGSADVQLQNDVYVAPVIGVPCKDNDKCEADIDLASISTGTPSTNDNMSEP